MAGGSASPAETPQRHRREVRRAQHRGPAASRSWSAPRRRASADACRRCRTRWPVSAAREEHGRGAHAEREVQRVAQAVGEEQLGHAVAAVALGDAAARRGRTARSPRPCRGAGARSPWGSRCCRTSTARRRCRPCRSARPRARRRAGSSSDANERVPVRRVAHDDDLAQVAQALARDRLQLWQQRLADDDHARPAVVQDVLVVGRLPQRVDRHRHRADLDRAEEAVGELRAVEQQQQDALFDAHLEPSRSALPKRLTLSSTWR